MIARQIGDPRLPCRKSRLPAAENHGEKARFLPSGLRSTARKTRQRCHYPKPASSQYFAVVLMRLTEFPPVLQQNSLELQESNVGHLWWSDSLRAPQRPLRRPNKKCHCLLDAFDSRDLVIDMRMSEDEDGGSKHHQIGGLQILHEDRWVDVTPTPGAFIVNIGDLLQLVSNDRFRSVEHKVVAKNAAPRVLIACFFSTHFHPASTRLYGPIKELLSDENPPLYRETLVRDYIKHYYSIGLDAKTAISDFRL
ncbi:hypothetical protein ZWY2020_035088 [Hordeum vulgare]|nr:hypothetical protein ZWY2020_035088 [Hordeum vulgare]